MRRDFGTADALLKELSDDHGTQVNDGRKEWRADGEPFRPRGYVRVAGDSRVSEENVDVRTIESLLQERADAKRARDYETADHLKATLEVDHAVAIDDVRRTWSVGTNKAGGYVLEGKLPGGFDLDLIESLLARRMVHKSRKEWRLADELQRELHELGVEMHDQKKLWRVNTSRVRPGPRKS